VKSPITHFPARPLKPAEQALVATWLASAGDVASAFVSSRRNDDPALAHRIIIITNPDDGPSHMIHAPSGADVWVVFRPGSRPTFRQFRTLRAALNSVRRVLIDGKSILVPQGTKIT
jgi:hypothetical protein